MDFSKSDLFVLTLNGQVMLEMIQVILLMRQWQTGLCTFQSFAEDDIDGALMLSVNFLGRRKFCIRPQQSATLNFVC